MDAQSSAPCESERGRRKLVCGGAHVCLQGGLNVLGRRQLSWAGPSPRLPFPPAYLALAEAAATGLGGKPRRLQTGNGQSAAGPWWSGRRAVGSWRTERRCQRARTQRREVLLKVRAATSPSEARAASRQSPEPRHSAPWRSGARRGWISVQPWVAGPRVGATWSQRKQ